MVGSDPSIQLINIIFKRKIIKHVQCGNRFKHVPSILDRGGKNTTATFK